MPTPPGLRCAWPGPVRACCSRSKTMAGAFPRSRSATPNPSAFRACASAPPCSVESSGWRAKPAKAPPSPFSSRGLAHARTDIIVMKILLADDHAVVRQGLKLILADHFKKAIFGEARNAHEVLSSIAKDKRDVVVLDITMPGRNGLEALRDIKQMRPKLPVLVLSMHPEDQFAVRMLKAGAAGYLTKESAGEELVGAIKKVVAGGRYISPALAERMAS